MEFEKLLYKRRSIRAFTERTVTTDEIEKLLTAATLAPSACNMQSWHFYAVTDAAVRAQFTEVCAAWAATAPLIVVVCTDGEAIISRFGERAKTFILQDTSLAIEYLLLQAADMGLGGCFMGAFDKTKCRELLNIPEKHDIVAVIPLGEPAAEIPSRERKPISEVTTFIGEAPSAAGGTNPQPYKLCGASLPNAVFDDLNLAGAAFNNINLHGARFTDINMSHNFFGGLTLEESYFGCVDLKGATFENPDLSGSSFKDCNFTDVKLENCDIAGMTVDGINVKAAIEFYKNRKK
ncbi:MAG: nitroreductase family protein [Clostridia bacterium]|nr:nitroreductase family protein [Clostridia bacterium]